MKVKGYKFSNSFYELPPKPKYYRHWKKIQAVYLRAIALELHNGGIFDNIKRRNK